MLTVLAVACTPGEPEADQPSVTGPLVLDAGCEPTDNVLRLACSMDLVQPEAVKWSILEDNRAIRSFETPSAEHHEIVLWGMPADTDLVWQAVSPIGTAVGAFRTEPLPPGVGDLVIDTDGTPAALDHVAVPYQCGGTWGVALVGNDGDVSWYEEAESELGAFDWGADGRVSMVRRSGEIRSLWPTGEERFELGPLGLPVHHDVAALGDRTYVLNADQVGDYIMDGLYVLDAQGALEATWSLADEVEPSGTGWYGDFWATTFPGAIDFSHTNAVTADGEGHLLLSLRAESAVARLSADPDAVDFGSLDWLLTGVQGGNLESTFAWSEPGGFFGQHHAQRMSSGAISVFDNGSSREQSRALVLDVDEETRVVAERTSWSMGTRCASQGGAYELDDGGMVATCNATATIHEFVADRAEPVFLEQIGCADGTEWFLQRAVPVDLTSAGWRGPSGTR